MKSAFKPLLCLALMLATQTVRAIDMKTHISIKQPGDKAVTYQLKEQNGKLVPNQGRLPLEITKTVTTEAGGEEVVTVKITANTTAYYNFGAEVNTSLNAADCEYYLPGFWYHRNLRSPKEAPSFHTSKSWNVREDRLSSPLAAVYDDKTGEGMTVLRQHNDRCDALTTHTEGEVILSGSTSVGYTGFDGEGKTALLTFGYPYIETPKRYIRKLTLAPAIFAFAKLDAGQSKTIVWRVKKQQQPTYSDFVAATWEYCFDRLNPQPLKPLYTAEQMKQGMSNYFTKSYVDRFPLKFNSGHGLRCDDCKPFTHMQIGFCGRVLLNAFNALEYGEAHNRPDLVKLGNDVFDSFLEHGFTSRGYFWDNIIYGKEEPTEETIVHSIRQQSEAAYAVFHYLRYERLHGRQHKAWEKKLRTLLDNFVGLIKSDGSFARKYHDNGTDIDGSGGSTPSATSTLVMGYKWFGDKRYLATAKRTVGYLENNIISKSDYFSSTLDANCEDKEAAISAVTATYYMAMMTKGKEQQHYIDLCRKATYFALSWYYLWDVPFAQGQMLGDLGLKSRGWGNVSVENSHIDVFVFEFPHIMKWLGEKLGEKRFTQMYDVIYTSLNQLLPTKERHCGIAVEGFYPEVVQHTAWDYGRNGKGFYNDIFAPAWAVASLWELYTPTRTDDFLTKKK